MKGRLLTPRELVVVQKLREREVESDGRQLYRATWNGHIGSGYVLVVMERARLCTQRLETYYSLSKNGFGSRVVYL